MRCQNEDQSDARSYTIIHGCVNASTINMNQLTREPYNQNIYMQIGCGSRIGNIHKMRQFTHRKDAKLRNN